MSVEDAAARAALEAGQSVRQAVCVVLSDSYEEALAALPADTQALTLLQSADEAVVLLTAAHLARLPGLVSLDVTAYAEAGVLLRSDALRALPRLLLLSLTGVKLEGAVEDAADNEVVVSTQAPAHAHQRRRRLPPWAYRTEGQSEDTPQLVFLKPAEVVPFSKFTELRRVNALHTFEGLEKLLMLRLHHADLVDLAWEMFNGLDNLQVLSLEHNGLAYVPDWSLYGAPALRYLSLAHNSLLDVSSTALVGLLELRFLDLSHNNLSHLSELSLPPFPKLQGADFRGNPIANIFTSTFQVMNSTETLVLGGSGTALQLQAGMFLGLRALRRLAATDVTATALHRDLLRGMPRLRDLTLRGVVPSLPYDAFVEVPKLERLVLRQCNIRHVSMDAFYALFALQELDLSHNQLRALPYGLLDQQAHLRELLLTGNQLTELPLGLLDVVPAKMVRLDGNPWDCSCDMASWNPAATNKDKREGRYLYDKRAAPTCATPERYAGWDVYDAMRRGFRCNKNPSRKLKLRLNALPTDTVSSTAAPAIRTQPSSNRVVVPEDGATSTPRTSTSSDMSSTPESGAFSSTATPEPKESMSTEGAAAAADTSSPAGTGAGAAHLTTPAAAPGAAHKRGKNRQHRKHGGAGPGPGGRLHHEHAQGEEGTQTKEGKYLLSDGKGGYIAVSRKSFKAAMEERRASTRPAPAAPPAAG